MTEGGRAEANGSPGRAEHQRSSSAGSSTAVAAAETSIVPDAAISAGQLFGPFSDPLQWIAYKYAEASTSPLDLQTFEKSGLQDLFESVEIARNSTEQNLSIVLDENGQFYFKALCDLDANSSRRKLFAWFSDELKVKLPQAMYNTLNGQKRYSCGLCNQVFINPNPVVVHILFSCPKRLDILPPVASAKVQPSSPSSRTSSTPPTSSISPGVGGQIAAITTPTQTGSQPKKRGFDIASLVEKDELTTPVHDKKRKSNSSGSPQQPSPPVSGGGSASLLHHMLPPPPASMFEPESKSAFRAPNPPSMAGRRATTSSGLVGLEASSLCPSLPPGLPPNLLSSLSSSFSNISGHGGSVGGSALNAAGGGFPSAFKKVDKSSMPPLLNASPSPFELAALYGQVRGLGSSGAALSQAAGLFHGHPALSQQLMSPPPGTGGGSGHHLAGGLPPTSLSAQLASHVSNASNSTTGPTIDSSNSSSNNGKSPTSSAAPAAGPIPPSLLPFLPPSLAALSFPSTNWCAKCNATFRMTSDLVYHMRSHHKTNAVADPVKKKREEKLKCNICGESFRERHHLARHNTSHQ